MQKITLSFGELREGMESSNRVYFYYVSPTQAQMGIRDCIYMTRSWTRESPPDENGNRITTMEYFVNQPVTIKLVNLYTTWGNKKEKNFVFIELNENDSRIVVNGRDGFGEIKCNGTVDFTRSTVEEDFLRHKMGFEVIMKAKPRKGVRNLIY